MAALTRKNIYFHSIFKLTRHRKQKYCTNDSKTFVAIPEIKAFIQRCMTAAGTREKHGEQLAEVLVAADYRGHFSHGLNRLGRLIHKIG